MVALHGAVKLAMVELGRLREGLDAVRADRARVWGGIGLRLDAVALALHRRTAATAAGVGCCAGKGGGPGPGGEGSCLGGAGEVWRNSAGPARGTTIAAVLPPDSGSPDMAGAAEAELGMGCWKGAGSAGEPGSGGGVSSRGAKWQ